MTAETLLEQKVRILEAGASGDFAEIAAAGAAALGHPVLLGDSILSVLCWSGPVCKAAAWEDYIALGYAPVLRPDRAIGGKRTLPGGLTAAQIANTVTGSSDLVVDLMLGPDCVGHLAVAGCGRPFSPETDDLLGTLCTALLGRFRVLRAGGAVQTLSKEQYLQALLTGALPAGQLAQRAALVGLAGPVRLQLLVVNLSRFQPVQISTSTLCRRLGQSAGGTALLHLGHVLVLSEHPPMDAAAITQVLAAARLCGVLSREFERPDAMKWHFDRCAEALRLQALFPAEDQILCPFDRIAACVTLSALPPEFRSAVALHPQIARLAALEDQWKFSPLETLGAYLACACRPQQTCRRLGLHRNTLDYRLRRICEAADIDFTDGVLLHDLFTSLLLLRMGGDAAAQDG